MAIKDNIERMLIPNSAYDGYNTVCQHDYFSERSAELASDIRGSHEPSIIIHGVMPRCGSVYVGRLLGLHPDLYCHPNRLWEIPFLETTGKLMDAQDHFFDRYKKNTENMKQYDLLPLFGASFMRYLLSFVPSDKRALMKIPDVKFLNFFDVLFPNENILLLMRDGRDLVQSTVKSWKKDFKQVCEEWNAAATMMLDNVDSVSRNESMYARYEDITADPIAFIQQACHKFMLPDDRFPFNDIDSLTVTGSSEMKQGGAVTWTEQKKEKNFKPSGKWHDWTNKQKRIFKDHAGETLIRAGYEKDNDW